MSNPVTVADPNAAPKISPLIQLREFWFYFSVNRGAVIGLVVFILLVLTAIFAHWIAPHSPIQQYRDALLVPPAWLEGGRPEFLLGTDAVGRDILSRLIHGSQYSMLIGTVVVVIALVTGIAVGLLAGYAGGWVDTLLMRIMDLILAFPSLLLALVLVAILGPGLINMMIAIALVLQPHFVRLTRSAVLGEMGKDYVTSARVATDCPGDAELFQRHPRRGGPWLPRPWRPAADPRMGHHARRSPPVHPAGLVGGDPAGSGHSHHGAGDQSRRRRPARCA
jgi:ABC-type antimicrobial peptide transport system permease subunit